MEQNLSADIRLDKKIFFYVQKLHDLFLFSGNNDISYRTGQNGKPPLLLSATA